MAKNNGGRPTVMTDLVVSKLEEAFSAGCTDIEACLYADISKQTLYDYQHKNPEFVDRKQALKENLKLHAKMNLKKSIAKEHDTNDSKWYLERKAKDEFSVKTDNVNYNANMNVDTETVPDKDIESVTETIVRKLLDKY